MHGEKKTLKIVGKRRHIWNKHNKGNTLQWVKEQRRQRKEDKSLLWPNNLQTSLGPFVYVIQILTFSISFSRGPRKTLYSLLAKNFILLWESRSFHNGCGKDVQLSVISNSVAGVSDHQSLENEDPEWGSVRIRQQLPSEAVSYPNIMEVIANFFTMAQQSLVGQGLFIIEASRSYWDTPQSVGFL